jgi:tRNA-2-methylthio-N6-dimethylallyladenosine synthase
MVDMAHFSGMVAAGVHPNPCEYADIVTSTTHKTLRGPRSGMILCREKYGAAIDKTIFPGLQGGPLVHVIAAKAVCFLEAMQPEFVACQRRVLANAKALASGLAEAGFRIVSGGTDTHLLLVDIFSKGLRGKEADRRPGDILAEVQALVDQGVVEVTLLGQNVNTYGVEFGDRLAFGKLLRACGEIEGLERVRFTSPHPAAFTDDVITAMAETPNVMPSLHMPLQSGSDRVLKEMRRSYRSAKFLGIIDRVREQIPDAAITTDIIVGFPGETDGDFEQTLKVVRQSRFSSAFTFQYSIRPGTPAATMDHQVPKAVVQERYDRLIEVQEGISWAENRALEGREIEVLVATGEGRKDTETHRLSGRARDNRLVHFAVPEGAERPRPGDMVTVGVTYGAPHHLVADAALSAGPYAVRRTAGGDAWQALQDALVPGKPAVSLGMPGVGRPAPAAATDAVCGTR